MNPIDSAKKWILNKLIPFIEKQEKTSTSEKDLVKAEGEPEPLHSPTTEKDKNEPYSDLLEDSEYPKG